MPNWVYCTFEVSGDKSELLSLKENIKDNQIFYSLLPTPQELVETPAKFHSVDDYSDREKLNMEMYGAINWYSWNILNWGTKWGDVDTELISTSETHLKYETSFAWSLPFCGIETISRQYPNLIFHFENVWETSGAFEGEITWQNGIIIDDQIKEGSFEDMEVINIFPKKFNICQWTRWTIQNMVHKGENILKRIGLVKKDNDEIPF
jgi:hypothetical protein